ncbi:MAG: hypothetical protein AAFV51_05965 [Pseudomonadota bacterium]
MTRRGQQAFPFDPPTPDFSEDALIVTDAIRAAVKAALAPAPFKAAVALIAPEGAGKRHIASIWAARFGGAVVDLAAGDAPAEGRVAAVGADRGAEPADLLRLLKRAEAGTPVLLCGRPEITDWSAGLPDIATRLKSVRRVDLPPPDDALVRALLRKRLADRGLIVSEGVLAFAAARAPRAYDGLQEVVERADRLAMEERAGRTCSLDIMRRAIETCA